VTIIAYAAEAEFILITNSQLIHEKSSTSLTIKEMQIKTTLGFNLIPVRMAIFKGKNNKCWQGCGKTGPLMHCWWECKLVQPLWKAVWRVLKKLKIELPYDRVIPFLSIYPKESNSGYNRDTCTLMYITALVTISKLWKNLDALQLMNEENMLHIQP
jgi:hypothetical protein